MYLLLDNKNQLKDMNLLEKKDPARIQYLKSRIEKFDEVCAELTTALNRIHDSDYPVRFWKLVLMIYVNKVVQNAFYIPAPNEKIGPEKPDLPWSQKIKTNLLPVLAYYVKSLMTIGNLSKLKKVLMKNNAVTHGFIGVDIASKDIGPAFPTYFPVYFKSDPSKREKCSMIATNHPDPFYKKVIGHLPIAFVEDFSRLYHLIPIYKPTLKKIHVSGIDSDFIRILLAKYVQHGARLFYYQHGGLYGEQEFHAAHYHDSSVADQFVTWGWKIKEKDLPGKAYRLFPFRDLYIKNKSAPTDYDCILCFPKIKTNNREKYKSYSTDFLSNIDRVKYKRILARPHPINKWNDIKGQLDFLDSNAIKIDSGRGKVAGLVAKSKIVVMFMHPTTNFLECLFVNHPYVGILTNDNPTDLVKPYYEFFIEHKVFHEDMLSIVEHLNTVDIEKWWQKVMGHPLYTTFKQTFCRDN